MNSFTKKTNISLWVTIFVYFLLSSGSTQNAMAQWGLFDTVWTRNNHSIQILSDNDSLFFLYNIQDTTSYLVHTLDLEQIKWSITSKYPITNVPLKFLENDNKILFLTWDKIINKTYYKVRNTVNFNVIDSIEIDYKSFPYNSGDCYTWQKGISEIDTSIYYAGYCGNGSLKGVSYKINYRTGQTTITSDSLPYFAMKISEDGQYISGIYFERRNITVKDSYYEILEVRRIKDYSLVYKNETYYIDYKPDFTPYQWVRNYECKFSKNNRYLLIQNHLLQIKIFDLVSNKEIFNSSKYGGYYRVNCFTKDSKGIFYKYSKGISEKIEYHLLELEDMQTIVYINNPEFPLFEGSRDGLVLNDNYFLSTQGCAVYDSNYINMRYLADISLAKLNFDINSIREPEQKYIGILYPNPAEDYIKIDLSNYTLKGVVEKDALRIFDIYGKCALNVGAIHELPLRIDVSSLPAGVYFVRIGNEKPLKFVKI